MTKTLGRFTFYPDRGRSPDEHMGRFGGGWQFRLGITAGRVSYGKGGTVLIGLGIREYRVAVAPLSPATVAKSNARIRRLRRLLLPLVKS